MSEIPRHAPANLSDQGRKLRPTLVLIAGANAAGKTTFTESLLRDGRLDGCRYINTDEMAAAFSGGNFVAAADYRKAAAAASEAREQCLAEGRSMAFETILSEDSRVDSFLAAKKAGFRLILFFIGTNSAQTNIDRAERRHRKGGRWTPEDWLVECHALAERNLRRILGEADEAEIYDNSPNDKEPAIQFRIEAGKVVCVAATLAPWARDILEEYGATREKHRTERRRPRRPA